MKRNGKTFSGTPTKVDTAKSYTTFTSADEKNPATWSEVELLTSKEEQQSLFKKISIMFKNIRYLYNLLTTSFVWISQTDYDDLSEEEKDSDTSYYIYDADSNDNAYTVPFTSEKYEAKNVGDALNEIDSSLEWKLIGSVTGTDKPISLPIETYNEFLIVTGTPVYKWSRHLTKNEVSTFMAFADALPSATTNTAQYVRGQITTSNEISILEVWQNGAPNNTSGTLVVYGK